MTKLISEPSTDNNDSGKDGIKIDKESINDDFLSISPSSLIT